MNKSSVTNKTGSAASGGLKTKKKAKSKSNTTSPRSLAKSSPNGATSGSSRTTTSSKKQLDKPQAIASPTRAEPGPAHLNIIRDETSIAQTSDDNFNFASNAGIPRKIETISLSLLAKRCIDNYQSLPPKEIMKLLNEITHVRLDREDLSRIDGLELLGGTVRNLYLQHNDLSCIDGLDTLTELKFLCLSHNQIKHIKNLKNTKLGFLDLSHNSIESIDVEELPTSLVILNLVGNQCQHTEGYRERVLQRCHKLSQLDGESLTVDERRAAGHDVVSESDESEDEQEALTPYNYSQPFDAQVVGVFDDLSSDMFLRCRSRIQNLYDQHKARVFNIEKLKLDGGLVTEEGAASNPTSRLSSRIDSPDTTDSSRPDTGGRDWVRDFDLELSNNSLSHAARGIINFDINGPSPPPDNRPAISHVRVQGSESQRVESRGITPHPPLISHNVPQPARPKDKW